MCGVAMDPDADDQGQLRHLFAAGDRPGADAFILGAGFSNAIGTQMPVLRDLAQPLHETLSSLGTGGASFPPTGDVELLMSSLAVDQPFLDEATNLRNRALFVDLRRWLAEHIFRAQQSVLGSPIPPWLEALVTTWHERQATVITLNYDTLIESAVMSLSLQTDNGRVLPQHTYPLPVEFAAPESFDRYGHRQTFELCKLHGSLSWFGSERPPQAPKEVEVWKDTFNSAARAPWEDIQQRALGLGEPFLVPPVLAKSAHFESELLRANWTRAYERLEAASTIVLIGYSLPPGDAQTAALLGSAAADKQILIVDTECATVEQRVRELLSDTAVAVVVSHDSPAEHAISDFAERYVATVRQ
jgi:hypothetical protein